MKRHSPAAERNRGPLAEVLREELPATGLVLEIASGTGEHAMHFACTFPKLEWQPSDTDPGALASIAAWREEALAAAGAGAVANLRAPIALDVCGGRWPQDRVAAILAVNLVHISPPEASEALFENAGQLLEPDAPLILYGPFCEAGVVMAPSNRAFDASLKARDPRWGLRKVSWLDKLATANGLLRTGRVAMQANNLTLVFRRHV